MHDAAIQDLVALVCWGEVVGAICNAIGVMDSVCRTKSRHVVGGELSKDGTGYLC